MKTLIWVTDTHTQTHTNKNKQTNKNLLNFPLVKFIALLWDKIFILKNYNHSIERVGEE